MKPPPVSAPETAEDRPKENGLEAVLPGEAAVARAARRSLDGHARGFSRFWPFLGPAFIAAVAYIDPGNFATNIAGGAKFGYLLLWVVLAANLMAMLIQYLSAKVGVATDRTFPELFREHYPRSASRVMWVQAEITAMSTDIAEFVGAALGLNLLFGVPMLWAGVITGVVAFGILALQTRGFRRFELAITGLLGIIFLGFLYETLKIGTSVQGSVS